MRQAFSRIFSVAAALSLALAACRLFVPTPVTPTPTSGEGTPTPDLSIMESPLHELTGSFKLTNGFVIDTYYIENAVMLTDMTGFVLRDKEWELPTDSQVLGPMDVDVDDLSGKYALSLPALPGGILHDVDNDGETETGIQVFATAYAPNVYGDLFYKGDDVSKGWPTYLGSVKTDPENEDEVIGGKLIVWAPDENQQFPTGFGDDGLLFTEDDPVGPIPAGYSVVDLDADPFTAEQPDTADLTLYEPPDAALKDFSNDSYTKAFDKIFEIVRKEYAFNGIAGKEPDWDSLYAELKPRVEKAEQDRDGLAFYQAVRDFTWAFKDGHVGLSSSSYTGQDLFDYAGSGYGFTLRELDDGKAVVTFVLAGGPAEKAGIKVGAEIVEFNGKPIKDAIGAVQPYFPQSSDFGLRLEQERFLVRAPSGASSEVTFINPGGAEQTATLAASSETETFDRGSLDYTDAPAPLLPVESRIIEEDGAQVGYVSVNSNYDDLNLIVRLFERALKEFEDRNMAGIIIDLRSNSGGAPLGLAGFLTDQEITLGQLEYFSETAGKFEPEGEPEKVTPYTHQYRFGKMVTLVGPNCASACELEAYGFSQVPGMVVMGEYPSAGVEAEVARGQFKLPEDIDLQIPTGRFVLPDGSLFLEGQGVEPTVDVPVDKTTVLSKEDAILQQAVATALMPAGQGVEPSGPPKFSGDESEISQAAQAGAEELPALARETYSSAELEQMGRTFTYTISWAESEDVLWGWGWCASSKQILDDNFEHISLSFSLDGEVLSSSEFGEFPYEQGSQSCLSYYGLLTDWPDGEHKLNTVVTFDAPINDGQADYAAGTQTFDYSVFVSP
jgi:C-terminal processing protease CtpA/Prc